MADPKDPQIDPAQESEDYHTGQQHDVKEAYPAVGDGLNTDEPAGIIGNSNADLSHMKALFNAVVEGRYRAEKAERDAIFEISSRRALQLGIGRKFFAPTCLFPECARELEIAILLSEDPAYVVNLDHNDSLTVYPLPQ